MAINTRPSVDTALLANSVPYTPKAFVIGPFATRVNFASQQRRALNLVWAINDDLIKSGSENGLRGKDVCVVGAGLAGLTAAAGIVAFGGNAWVLEREAKRFHRMRRAGHRDIHPTINFWPQEDVNPSTFLPFFNWHQDSCNSVLSKVWAQWKKLEQKSGIKGITFNCDVKDFKIIDGKWKIEAGLPDNQKMPRQKFHALVLATGFGDEKFPDGGESAGYWEEKSDRIEAIRQAPSNPCDHYVVSGTGDGGIIEVLRLLFSGFKAGGIEAVMNTIMADEVIPNKVMEIERKIQHELTDHLLHESFPINPDTLSRISNYYWKSYRNIVNSGRLSEFFESRMEEMRTCVERVTLLGIRETPLDINQSPFHKLLLTYAYEKGLLDYYQVTKTQLDVSVCSCETHFNEVAADLDISLKCVAFEPVRRIWMEGSSHRNRAFSKSQELHRTFHLSRHGYASPIDEFFPLENDRNIADLIRHRQALYADQDFLTQDQADYFAGSLGLTRPSNINDWIADHLEELQVFFRKRHGVDLMTVDVDRKDGRDTSESIAVQLVRGENFDPDKYSENQWMIPKRFYGIRVFGLDEKEAIIESRGGF